jgi:hypothetical protein
MRNEERGDSDEKGELFIGGNGGFGIIGGL